MPDTTRTYEVRCPVHGFIRFSDLERDVINHPVFQRLRRIRQLAWTDYTYPGAMHTRFEHSLGVMHVAGELYDAVTARSHDLLRSYYGPDDEWHERDRVIVRLAALLHDIGHAPFSHAGEDLFPVNPAMPPNSVTGKPARFKHEFYSVALIRSRLAEAIDGSEHNRSEVKAADVADLLDSSVSSRTPAAGRRLLWREMIAGQMDADRMDYLLRDSLHTGVDYGRFDWRRLLNTVQAVERPSGEGNNGRLGLRIGISRGGVHAAEALVLARYFMFTQVYFHKTRVAYDCHFRHALKAMLPEGTFPQPDDAGLLDYLRWDDWRVLGLLAEGNGGDHGRRLRDRNHYREVYHTPDAPTPADLDHLCRTRDTLGELVVAEVPSSIAAYKLAADADIAVETEDERRVVRPLSYYSAVVQQLSKVPLAITRLYAAAEARRRVAQLELP